MCANVHRLAGRPEFQLDSARYLDAVSLRETAAAHFRASYRPDSLLGHPRFFQRLRLIAYLDSTDFAAEALKAPVDSVSRLCMARVSDELKKRPPLSRQERESLALDTAATSRLWKSLPDSTRILLTLNTVIPDFSGLLRRARYMEVLPRAAPLFQSPAVQLAYREHATRELLRASSLPGSMQGNPASLRRIYYHKMAIILSDALWEYGEPEPKVPMNLSSYLFGSSYELPKSDSALIVERARAFGRRYHSLRARMAPFNRSDTLEKKFNRIDSLIKVETVAIERMISRRLSDRLDELPGENVELNIPGSAFPEFIPASSLSLIVRKWVRNIVSSRPQNVDGELSPVLEGKTFQGMKATADSREIDKAVGSVLRSGGLAGQKLRLVFAKSLYYPYNGPLSKLSGDFQLN